jgi:hypothetical protein
VSLLAEDHALDAEQAFLTVYIGSSQGRVTEANAMLPAVRFRRGVVDSQEALTSGR